MATTHTLSAAGFRSFAPARPVRPVHWKAPTVRAAAAVPGPRTLQAAEAVLRFVLALLPFSALAAMFVWL